MAESAGKPCSLVFDTSCGNEFAFMDDGPGFRASWKVSCGSTADRRGPRRASS